VNIFKRSGLVRNAGWMLVGQGLGYGLRVVYFIVIARLLGVLQYGIVVGAFGLVNLVAEQSRLGAGTVMLRFVSPNHSRFAEYWGNVILVTLTTSGTMILLLRLIAPQVLGIGSAEIVLFTAIGSCFFEQITISSSQAFQAFQRMPVAAALNQLTSMLRTVAAVGMLITMHRVTAVQWSFALMTSSAIGSIVGLITVTLKLGWPRFRPFLALKHVPEGAEYAFSASTTCAYNDLDKTMLSHYGMSVADGIYGMAYRIIDMATVPLMSIQIASQPRLFQLAKESSTDPIRLGWKLQKNSCLMSLLAAAVMFFTAPIIPYLVGKGFAESVSALRWLCLIPVFRSIHVISGSVLTSIGQQRYRTVNQLAAVLFNFTLNLWLIPRYSWHGAAWSSLATDGGLAILNFITLRGVESRMTKSRVYRSPAVVELN